MYCLCMVSTCAVHCYRHIYNKRTCFTQRADDHAKERKKEKKREKEEDIREGKRTGQPIMTPEDTLASSWEEEE